MIIFHNMNNVFIKSLQKLLYEGISIKNGRNGNYTQIDNFLFRLENPNFCYVSLKSRNLNIDYPITEFAWYLSTKKDSTEISKHATLWANISDKNNEVESNYGYYAFSSDYEINKNIFRSQWSWCIDEFLQYENSRRVTINILQPYHKYANGKDMPCTFGLNFYIENNSLNLTSIMRSQDVIYGLCNDIFCFSMFLQLMYNELKQYDKFYDLKLGAITHFVTNLHIYENHYKKYLHNINNLKQDREMIKEDISIKIEKNITYRKFKKYYLDHDYSLDEIAQKFKNSLEIKNIKRIGEY